MRVLDDALASSPDDPALRSAHVQLYVLLVQERSTANALDEADTVLGEGLQRYPGETSLRYSQALLLEDQGKNSKAVDVLESLAKDKPDDPAVLNALGYLLTDQFDRHEEARSYIEKALALNPDSPAIIDSMGWVLYKLGDYSGARDYLERAYRLEQDPEIAAHLVDVRWALGEHDSALELLRAVARAQSRRPPPQRGRRTAPSMTRAVARLLGATLAAALLAACATLARRQRRPELRAAPRAARGRVRLGDARPRRGLDRRARVSGELPLAPGRRRARSRVRGPLRGALAGRAARRAR